MTIIDPDARDLRAVIDEESRDLERQQVRNALDAAFVRGYQLGVDHGQKAADFRHSQFEEQYRIRATCDALMPNSTQ